MLLYQALALLSTSIYFAGLVSLKNAVVNMPRLAGDRPLELARVLLGDRAWIGGAATLGAGACVQTVALTRVPLLQALPLFLAGLAVLLVLTMLVMGERLTRREWGCALALGMATVVLADASGIVRQGLEEAPALIASAVAVPLAETSPVAGAPAPLIVAVALPSLLVPVTALLAVEGARTGVHARPVNGVALAINVGLLTGTAELMLKGTAGLVDHPYDLIRAPYLYLFIVTAALALAQLQIALQRCRLAIVGLVATATAKTYLFVAATAVYREPWPDGRRAQIVAALVLTVVAVAAVPHHEPARAAAVAGDGGVDGGVDGTGGADDEPPRRPSGAWHRGA